MPFFDPAEQRVCVRIVYDGVGGAGKTTNLRKLCELFASQRAVSFYSPSEVDGRTVYFDWAQILAGSVCGFPLMCQVVSVPGQLVLTPRRRQLLASADVIVLVCDSTSAGADAARFALGVLEESKRDARVGLLIQANKQDQPGALAGPELLSRLGRESAPVVEAIATDGIGVIDTFVSALRLVSRAMQTDTEDGRLHLDVRRAESAADVLDRLRRQAVDPEWAAEMLLEEALTEMLVAGGTAHRGAERSAKVADPMLPSDDVLPGFIWPGQTGRAVLRTIARESRERTVPIDADGQAEHHAPGHIFRTRLDLRFEDREQARVALVAAARQHAQLGALLSPDAVLVAQPASDGAWWIWVSTPHATTVEDALAAGTLDASALAEQYGAAVVDALCVSVRHGLPLDLAPSSFTLAGETLRHVAPFASGTIDPDALDLSGGFAAALVSVETAGAFDAFLGGFERAALHKLTPDEVARIASGPPARSGTRTSLPACLSAVLARVAAA